MNFHPISPWQVIFICFFWKSIRKAYENHYCIFFFLSWSNFIYMMIKNCLLPFRPLPIHFVYTYNLLSLYRVACAQDFSRDEFSSASHFHMLLWEKHKKSLWEPLLHFFPKMEYAKLASSIYVSTIVNSVEHMY